jgi:non-ribosomal peptide synthetase component E (peptide arylation enzyme)
MDQWDPAAAAMLIERHGIGHMSATPYHLISLLDAAEADGRDIRSLRDCLVGAATVPPQLVARCDAVGMNTYRCYGSSEHPTATVGRASDPLKLRLETDGRCTPGTEVRIVDDTGQDVPSGHEGEVALRGPELFSGYQREELNAQAFLPDGWFLTGDVGRVDAEGNLTITDRKKDIIIRGGENISSRAVEDALLRHPGIADAAAVAMPDPVLGERVCAFVVPRPEQRATLAIAALKDFFIQLGVAKQLTPEKLVLVDELPRTAAGKVKKHELRAQVRAEGAPNR